MNPNTRTYFIFVLASNGRGTWHTNATGTSPEDAAEHFLSTASLSAYATHLVVIPSRSDNPTQVANPNNGQVVFKLVRSGIVAEPGI